MNISKSTKRIRKHAAVRSRISGTGERPRLAVFRSSAHMYVQLIDDLRGITLAASSDLALGTKGTKTQRSIAIGSDIAARAKQIGVTAVVFDRGGFRYAGRVRALADSARAAGLQF